ncbi:ATP-grasp domain-containing protein [Corynebacterium cystitidis]|uniref:ATP-grasp domain-containing protein n=1 Tax=Corynebacterium cystitidis TaxID=35757 RepID=UPI00211E985C|nr:ATP-grasp domain-containing protein [Corynebacterium cystitidis]
MLTTFLITGVGGPAGSSLSTQLQERGHTVVGVDMLEIAGALQGPRADSPDLIPLLRTAITEHDVDIFIPTVQDELPFVAAAAPLLPCTVVLSDPLAIGLAHDKWFTAQYCSDNGLAVPATVTGSNEFTEFPHVIKPRVARGGRGVVVIDRPEDDSSERNDALIRQSFASGDEYCPQLFIGRDGDVLCVNLRKTKLRDGRVGNADGVERADHAGVETLAKQVAQLFNLRGPVDMDIRLTNEGTPVLLEINARFGANSAHAPEILDALLAEVS